ncbi:hypothetical protein AB0P36_23975 [Streptomyces flavidovirens]|uniref:hypothetical protein n=1 Tax=Streptomyces flavidovirens TaxID=67298 RepID=UPI003449EC6C
MTVSQLPAEAEAFARYLRELTALVDTGAGWCGVFWQRDPDGMRACLDGAELPPWDVLEALLQDVAASTERPSPSVRPYARGPCTGRRPPRTTVVRAGARRWPSGSGRCGASRSTPQNASGT